MSLASTVMPPVAFSTAFERLNEVVSKEDARSFNSTTMEDVWTSARDIERHLESRRSLRGFRRIQPFLAGIEQYSKVVEILCNGTPYLPYIWAPIKLLLQIAQGHISALEKLIDAYAMIGEAMPRFDRLSAAFKDDPEFQQVMGHFYEDVLEFHRRAYMFFRRRSWKLVFDSLWKSFNLRFSGILESLRKHRDLIDQEANAINIAEAKTWRTMQLDQFRQWRADRAHDIDRIEQERQASQTREAVAWFGASEDQEDYYTKYSRPCDGTKGHWALEKPIIISWLDQSRDNPVLWLNGKPGAGKSVICSKLIEHIQEKTNIVTIFYFFSHNQTFPKHATEVLRSFATQLLAASAGLAPYILETFANSGQRATKRNLAIIIEKMIASLQNIRIVVDGLDECPQDEQDEVIEDLLRIRGPVPGACKVLLSSRKHRNISKLLQSQPTFRLDDNAENINATIASFVQPRLQYLRQAFSSEIIDELGHQLLAKANGMFLWVKLIIFTLEDLYFESDLREAIEKLPEDLETVYEKIFLRICGGGRTPNQRTAIRILQWMLVAQRPLKRCELESGIVLDERVSRPRGDVLSLCHPILDAEDDLGGSVSFIHFTAQEYLRKLDISPFFQFRKAQLTVSLSCVLYLSSSLELVDPRVTGDEIRSNIVEGFHDLHLYANDHWLDHLQGLVNSPADSHLGGTDLKTLCQALERLTVMHNELAALRNWSNRGDSDLSLSPRGTIWHSLQTSQAVQKLLDGLLAYRNDVSVNNGMTAVSHSDSDTHPDPTLFSMIRTRYQSIMEGLLETEQVANTVLHNFRARHSSGGFLCRYRSCPRAGQGFNTLELRQKHEESHAPRFQCVDAACGFTFNTRAAMKKHAAQYHDEENTASVPDSLIARSRGSYEDRPLFTLTEVKTETKSKDQPQPPPGNALSQRTPEEHNSLTPAQKDYQEQRRLLEEATKRQRASVRRRGRNVQEQRPVEAASQNVVTSSSRDGRVKELKSDVMRSMPTRLPIPMSPKTRARMVEKLKSAGLLVRRLESALPLYLSLTKDEEQTKDLLQSQITVQQQLRDTESGVIPIDNFTITLDELEVIQTKLHGYIQFMMLAKVPRIGVPVPPAQNSPDQQAPQQQATARYENIQSYGPPIASDPKHADRLENFNFDLFSRYYSEDLNFGQFQRDYSGDLTFDPSTSATTTPSQSRAFSDLTQAANSSHLTAKSASPAIHASEQRSPFRESSQYAEPPLASAAQFREQQKYEADAQAYVQHQPSRYYIDPPGTMLPKEALLEYDETEVDAEILSFPPEGFPSGSIQGDSYEISGNDENDYPLTEVIPQSSIEGSAPVLGRSYTPVAGESGRGGRPGLSYFPTVGV